MSLNTFSYVSSHKMSSYLSPIFKLSVFGLLIWKSSSHILGINPIAYPFTLLMASFGEQMLLMVVWSNLSVFSFMVSVLFVFCPWNLFHHDHEIISHVTFRSFITFRSAISWNLIFHMIWCRGQASFFPYGYPIVPALFIINIIFPHCSQMSPLL